MVPNTKMEIYKLNPMTQLCLCAYHNFPLSTTPFPPNFRCSLSLVRGTISNSLPVFTSYNSLHLPESHHPNCLFLYSFCFIFSFSERLSLSQSPYLIRLLLFLSVDFGSGSEFGHKNLHGSKFRSMWIWSESSMLTALTVTTKMNNYNKHLVSLGEWHWIAGIISPHFFCTYVGSEGLILS